MLDFKIKQNDLRKDVTFEEVSKVQYRSSLRLLFQ